MMSSRYTKASKALGCYLVISHVIPEKNTHTKQNKNNQNILKIRSQYTSSECYGTMLKSDVNKLKITHSTHMLLYADILYNQ